MVLDPTKTPEAAKEKSIVEKVNEIGVQRFSIEKAVEKGPVRITTVIVAIPLDSDFDLQKEWSDAVTPLLQKGVLLEEIARADITEDPGEGFRISARSETEIRIEKETPIVR